MTRKIDDLIQGQTPLPPDFKHDLIPKHIVTYEELNEYEARNIEKAYQKYMVGNTKKRDLTRPDIILKIHKDMYGDVWKWAGHYRKTETNIGVLPGFIPSKLAELCKNLEYWIANDTYPNKREMAVVFHHKLVHIHPFPNGNGRLARMCANILAKQYKTSPIQWASNLTKISDSRKAYLEALKAADKGQNDLLSTYWSEE